MSDLAAQLEQYQRQLTDARHAHEEVRWLACRDPKKPYKIKSVTLAVTLPPKRYPHAYKRCALCDLR